MRKSRSDLQTDREDEQNQPEFLHEMPDLAVHRHSEMTQDDAHEQNPRDSERDAADFNFSEQNAMVMTNAKVSTAWAMPLPKNKVCNHSILTYFCTNCQ